MSAPINARARASLPQPDAAGLARFLYAKHPRNTAKLVARDTGCGPDTVRNWLGVRNRLSLPHMLALLAAYGPDALKALWPGPVPAWMDDQAIAREEAELARMHEALTAKRAALALRRRDGGQ